MVFAALTPGADVDLGLLASAAAAGAATLLWIRAARARRMRVPDSRAMRRRRTDGG